MTTQAPEAVKQPEKTSKSELEHWINKQVFDFEVAKVNKCNVFGDRWRIDFYSKEKGPFMSSYKISKSFFISVNNKAIIDLTI